MNKKYIILILATLFFFSYFSLSFADDLDKNWPKTLPKYPNSNRVPGESNGQDCSDIYGAGYFFYTSDMPKIAMDWYLKNLDWQRCVEDLPIGGFNGKDRVLEVFYNSKTKTWAELDFMRLSQAQIDIGLGPTELGFNFMCNRNGCFDDSRPKERAGDNFNSGNSDNSKDFFDKIIGWIRKIIEKII